MHEFIINNTNLTLDLMIQEFEFINKNLSSMINENNFKSVKLNSSGSVFAFGMWK